MSKARKRFTNTQYKQLAIHPDFVEPPDRAADEVDADVLRATTSAAGELPYEVRKALHTAAVRIARPIGCDTEWDSFKRYTLRQQLWAHVREENEFIAGLVMDGVERGFRLAVERYAKQLRNVPELAAWRRKRVQGGRKGRASQTAARQERATQAQAMLEAGQEVPAIAKHLGCSISTVYRALNISPSPRDNRTRRRRRR